MGEQDTSYSSNPIFIVIMRNSRGKLFVYVAVLGVLCFIVFLLSSTHTSLKELEGVNEKCQQQRDSLSAQLQVVYEHKNRLEKSLQQEKTDHKRSKEANEKQASDLENKLQKEKDDRHKLEIQISQLKTSYSDIEEEKTQAENALKQQLKTVQTQKDSEIEKLQSHISDLLSEKEKLEVSNNAFGWKLEQHASELSLCHLQLQQTKAELHTCQEQLRMHSLNTADKIFTKPPEISNAINEVMRNEKVPFPQKKPLVNHENVAQYHGNDVVPQENQGLPLENQPLKISEDKGLNMTSSPAHEKPSLLEKPHIMPSNNVGDGVLPKPMDLNLVNVNNDLDAAVEIDSKKNELPKLPADQLSVGERDVNAIAHPVIAERKDNMENNIPNLNRLQDNHPQVAPPNFENVEEKDDHAAERGEDGIQRNATMTETKSNITRTEAKRNKTRKEAKRNKKRTETERNRKRTETEYGNLDGKQQVEGPVLGRQNVQPKDFPVPQQENNDIVAQMQDMMNKSPGDVNHAGEQNVLGMPPHFAPVDTKHLKNDNFIHRGADGHHIVDDKNYEEDDEDDRDNDEPPNGLAPVLKVNNNILQDNDFDDQDNQDNGDNAKEEEGVVVAPK